MVLNSYKLTKKGKEGKGMTTRPLPIGIDDYKKLIDNGYYYVDKTLLIKELLDKKGEVNLFTRPRRFGKTLALSMLQCYFEIEMDAEEKQIRKDSYFQGMKILDAGDIYTSKMGQYPVISLSLKSAKQPTFEMAYLSLVDEIAKEYKRHKYILKSNIILESDKEHYQAIMEKRANRISYAKAIDFLSEILFTFYEKKVIILLDEYDVPLENAYFKGFYTEMVDFIRSLFESALKTNRNLEFAVITGCLRISKESIFTGLNNLKIISITSHNFSEYFGFTQSEVSRILEYYGGSDKNSEVQKWYDGYFFGETEVYNPWSVINYADNNFSAKPYWSNTSSNSIIRHLVEQADQKTKAELQELMDGGVIEKPVHENITYEDMDRTKDNLWNFLFFTGYLKKISERLQIDTTYLKMKIPNAEVKYIYRNTIMEWFEEGLQKQNFSDLYQAMEERDTEKICEIITCQLSSTISFMDYAENFYHGFLAGILSQSQKYIVKSNREQGNGRSDIYMYTSSRRGRAFILELKMADNMAHLEPRCREGLEQIERNRYEQDLKTDGYEDITCYAIAFFQKDCEVLVKK